VIAITVVATLVGLYVAYVFAANLLLRTAWARSKLNGDPTSLEVDWQRASTWWPGRLRVRGLRIRIRDSGREIEIRADDARARIDWISALFRRRLHLRDAEVHGAEFRYRGRRTSKEVLEEKDLDALPPIAGFDPIPQVVEPDTGPLPDELYDLVGISLDDLHADGVREIWIDQYRFRGDVQVRGTFHLQPQRWLEVRDTTADVASGRVTLGDVSMIERLAGRVELAIDPYDPRTTHGDALAGRFHGHVALGGELGDARFVEHWLRGPDAAHVGGGGGGALRAEVRIERGRISAGTTVRAQIRDVAIVVGEWTCAADASLAFDVTSERGGPVANLSLDIEDARARLRGDERLPVVASTIGFRARARELALVRAFNDAEASLEVPDVRAPAVLLRSVMPAKKELKIERGELSAHAHLDVSLPAKIARGDLGVRAIGARVRAKDSTFEGDLDARLAIPRAWYRAIDLDGTFVEVHDVREIGGDTRGWFGRVETNRARVRTGDEGTVLDADLQGRARDASFIAPLVAAATGAPKWLQEIIRLPDLRATAKLVVGPGGVDVRSIRATSDTSTIFARVQLPKRGDTRAAVLVKVGDAAAGIEIGQQGKRVVLANAESWYRSEAGAAESEVRALPRGGGRR
jgi:hypothetical protein